MPGVKGAGGPVPKRSDQRRRVNKPDVPIKKAAGGKRRSATPRPDPKWHPVARRWFNSLARSGQSAFYEASDWATAFVIGEAISRELSPQPIVVGRGEDAVVEMHELPPKGASLAAWLKAMTSLLVTEGDRRRARLELEVPSSGEKESADVSELDDYRHRLQQSG